MQKSPDFHVSLILFQFHILKKEKDTYFISSSIPCFTIHTTPRTILINLIWNLILSSDFLPHPHHLLEWSYRCWPLHLFGLNIILNRKRFFPIIWTVYKLVMRTAACGHRYMRAAWFRSTVWELFNGSIGYKGQKCQVEFIWFTAIEFMTTGCRGLLWHELRSCFTAFQIYPPLCPLDGHETQVQWRVNPP